MPVRWSRDPRPDMRKAVAEISREEIQRRARNVLGAAKANLRVRSESPRGEIERTLDYTVTETTGGFAARVGSDDERALWVEEGTGVYGPHHAPVVPRFRRWMRFRSTGGATVFAKQTKGQPGKHYLRDAAEAARD